MDNLLLTNIVNAINDHRTWLDAVLSDEPQDYHVLRAGSERIISGRTLRLTAYREDGNYQVGQKWIIHEYVLNQSVRKLRAFDPIFAHHYAKQKLTLKEIERVVSDCTNGFVHLKLCQYGYW